VQQLGHIVKRISCLERADFVAHAVFLPALR
jgi:hypothetical protein